MVLALGVCCNEYASVFVAGGAVPELRCPACDRLLRGHGWHWRFVDGEQTALRRVRGFFCRRTHVVLPADRKPEEFLLRDREGHPHTRGWLRDLVVEVCGKANVEGQPVRKVCPHGLRGTHATLLRVLLGRGIGDIANALRHGDEGRTATRHYVGAPERRPALRVLIGGMDEGEADGISYGISSGGRGQPEDGG